MSEMVRPFPPPSPHMYRAYMNLSRLEQAKNPDQVKDLGPVEFIPRPWDPGAIMERQLRLDVWDWLDRCVDWLNTEHAWQLTDIIPSCWPHHPHLVHELASLCDQRRRAGLAATSDMLEDWHRYALPAFHDRMRQALRTACDAGHRPMAGAARITSYRDETATRADVFAHDVEHLEQDDEQLATTRFALVAGQIVDTTTGEVLA